MIKVKTGADDLKVSVIDVGVSGLIGDEIPSVVGFEYRAIVVVTIVRERVSAVSGLDVVVALVEPHAS